MKFSPASFRGPSAKTAGRLSSLWRYPSRARAYIEPRLFQNGKLELALEGSNQRRSLGNLLIEGVGAGLREVQTRGGHLGTY